MVSSLVGGVPVAEQVPLAPLTTLRVGPIAHRVITCETTDAIIAVIRALDGAADSGERALVLAGGSNVVLADEMPDLTVVRLANAGIHVDGDIVRAEAGAVWDDVVVTAIEHGLGGLECLSGIPGSAGATPVQNVGAYGAEVSDTIRRVRLLDRATGEDRWVDGEVLGFGYRTSILRHSDAAIALEVEFALDADGRSAPLRYGELTAALGAEPGSSHRSGRSARRRAGLAETQGHGARRGRPRHLERRLVLHQPGRRARGLRPDPGALGRTVPNYPAPNGVKLAAGWLVEHAGFRKGYPG